MHFNKGMFEFLIMIHHYPAVWHKSVTFHPAVYKEEIAAQWLPVKSWVSCDLPGLPWLHIDSKLPMETVQWQRDECEINPAYTKGLWILSHIKEEKLRTYRMLKIHELM